MNAIFHQVIVYVSDTISCANFYSLNFGLKALGTWDSNWAELEAGSCRIAFHQAYDESGKPTQSLTGSENNPHKLVFKVSNVEKFRADLMGKNIRMSEIRRFGSIEMSSGIDPEGNVFQITN